MEMIHLVYCTFANDLAATSIRDRCCVAQLLLQECFWLPETVASLRDTEDNMSVYFVVAGLEDPIVLPPSHLNTRRGRHGHTLFAQWHRLPVLAQMLHQ